MNRFCNFCGEDITELCRKTRHYSSGRTPARFYCNKDHRAQDDKQNDHFKAMSIAGRQARSEAVAKSNQEHPRRQKLPSRFTVKEAAVFLGIEPGSVWSHIDKGHLRAEMVKHSYFIALKDLRRFKQHRRKKGRHVGKNYTYQHHYYETVTKVKRQQRKK